MAEYADHELRLGRGHPDQFDAFLERMAEARAAIAAVLAADVGSIALTHATTDGMNVATWAVDWRAGERAVTTRHEHAGALGPLATVRRRFGVELSFAEIGDGEDDERTLAAFDAAIAPGTRLVSLSHVLWTTGAVLPVARIAEIAHARGALVAVDGAQSVGAIPVLVEETGADFYAIAGQKWLLGPEGTGALWASGAAIDRAAGSHAGWFAFARLEQDATGSLHADARRFDASGWFRPAVVGLARSAGWLSMYVGLPWIQARGAAMARSAAVRLAAIPGVHLVTPPDRMATLVTFRIAGWDAQPALDELAARTFAIARTVPALDAIRLSVGFFTTEAEVERVAETVELLAAHTPETLPRRQRLAMLGQDGG
jgi:L-cysteine/cystine lyase